MLMLKFYALMSCVKKLDDPALNIVKTPVEKENLVETIR